MYFAGLVTERQGATVEHAMLAMNLCGELYLALRGREYVVLGSDVLLETGSQEMLTYPDLMVFCEPAKLKPGKRNIVTNPTLVVEVLSPHHRNYRSWRQIPRISLKPFRSPVRASIPGSAPHRDPHPRRRRHLVDQ